jgi:hypothetical protein
MVKRPGGKMIKPGDFGVSIYRFNAVKKPCKDCPFKREKEGTGYLTKSRMDGIKFAVTMGQPFHCHKTVYQKGIEHPDDGTKSYHPKYRPCRGAVDYAIELAEELGIKPTLIGEVNDRSE